MMRFSLSAVALAMVGSALAAQTILPPFNAAYSWRSIGSVPGVPSPYGGATFKHNDPDVLLIGGAANSLAGAVYEIRVTRDVNGFITGFVGTATQLSTAPNIDGGLIYGPNNVLFYSAYPINAVGQIKVGSTVPDRIDSLGTLGWTAASPGALTIVPPGYPGAGQLKVCSWSGGSFHSCTLVPDGNGTFSLSGLTPRSTLAGGPEGLLYPPPGSPAIPDYQRIMVCDYSGARIYLSPIDANGDPTGAAPTEFMTGISGAEGATIDARSGSFLFSTYGGGDRIILVDGFGSCGPFVNYGSGIPGAGNRLPVIRGVGCARIGQAIAYQVGNGPANASGALNIGFQQLSIPLFGGFVLTEPSIPIGHALDGLGAWQVSLNTPPNAVLVGAHVYFQAVYLDLGAPFSITASDGLDMTIF
ncbi:MAG: hypothetical protein IT457_05490 [Planctomycetes bacterium]|nr:hypothetical protein [Planctomycetota bacterium]